MYWYCKEKPDVDQFIFRAKPAIPPHHWREKAVEIQAKDQVVVVVEVEVEVAPPDQYQDRLKGKVDLREWVLNLSICLSKLSCLVSLLEPLICWRAVLCRGF